MTSPTPPDVREIAARAIRAVFDDAIMPEFVPDSTLADAVLSAVTPMIEKRLAEKLAVDFDRIADSARQTRISTPPEYPMEIAVTSGRQQAFMRAAEICHELAKERS